MTSAFESYAKQVMRLVFNSVMPNLARRKKSYQMLELTFAIDDTYTFWYLGANNSPQLSRTPKIIRNIINPMNDEVKSLVLELSDLPEAFVNMRYGDRYGKFRLVYSEYEADIRNTTYNPCTEFNAKWSLAKSAVLGTASLHDYKTRVESANLREVKKFTRAAWDKCRAKYKNPETCLQSETVRKVLNERYANYVDKASVSMDSSGDEEGERDARDAKIAELVEARLREMAGIGEPGAEGEDGAGAGAGASASGSAAN
eukprot:CAMPEP_0202072388 /NCGR_PEP_ID=MMETSP0964-20121228/2396_1 /ASSEMBLY_ACC=CAM_ASM_000500 /TAXON_ID=4773 /ORGANISM="Schizochytrium aggregatum, Strain ATCC28209" /LENGTH=257 /DNA_ID=CAMNT_0048639417 /DNA_START=11 /DNA_END=784 /DNA_ORIENTATION=-